MFEIEQDHLQGNCTVKLTFSLAMMMRLMVHTRNIINREAYPLERARHMQVK
ncbi:MAG: hypothetical protein LBB06_02080 [Endomicrobium sp.]|nr:hypothetical protein [Endomicrobium sp.]